MTYPKNGTVKTVLSVGGALAALITAAVGYGYLQGEVAANANNIKEHSERLEKIEDRSGDIRERLKGLETGQKFQTDILKDIKRSLENRSRPD